ncbi:hypothetical protein ACU686_34075 [Yinghuangia aomiensis]
MSDAQPQRTGRTKMVAVAAGAVFLGMCAIQNDLKSESGPAAAAAAQASPSASASPAASAATSAEAQRVAVPDQAGPRSAPRRPCGSASGRSAWTPLRRPRPERQRRPRRPERDQPQPGGLVRGRRHPGRPRRLAIVLGHVDTKLGPAVFSGPRQPEGRRRGRHRPRGRQGRPSSASIRWSRSRRTRSRTTGCTGRRRTPNCA